MVEIPGTEEGVRAIEALLVDGIGVNVTLLFGVPRYEAVARAYLNALDRRREAGLPIGRIASVASFCLGRIDALVDRQLSHRVVPGWPPAGPVDPDALRGQIAVANARVAHRSLRQLLASTRWRRLRDEGAPVQRLLWAGTGAQRPNDDPLKYVQPLIGANTVSAMAVATLAAFAASRPAAAGIEQGVRAAARTLRDLRRIGIDIRRIAARLEDDAIDAAIEDHDRLLALIGRRRGPASIRA